MLCDALALACETDPGIIIDFATLTGAARTALGTELPALFCNDDALADGIVDAGRRVADPVWRMPLHQPYRKMLDSKVADLVEQLRVRRTPAQSPPRCSSRAFVNAGVPWAHFDLMAWNLSTSAGPSGGRRSDGHCARCMLTSPIGSAASRSGADDVHRDESLQDCTGTRRGFRGRVAQSRELSRHACRASKRSIC